MRIFLFLLLALPLFAQEPQIVEEDQAEEKNAGLDLFNGAGGRFDDDLRKLKVQYMNDLANAVMHADRAEIFLLDFEVVNELPGPQKLIEKTWPEIEEELNRESGKVDEKVPEEEPYFPIVPYESYSKILRQKKLEGEALVLCREAVADLLRNGQIGGGAFCHFPIHGIRLFIGEIEIFETSLCWKCGNFFLKFPNQFNDASWIGIGGGKIGKFCMKEMPIPQSEIDRFNSKYGPKK